MHSVDYDERYGVWAALTPDERARALAAADGDLGLVMFLWTTGELFAIVVQR